MFWYEISKFSGPSGLYFSGNLEKCLDFFFDFLTYRFPLSLGANDWYYIFQYKIIFSSLYPFIISVSWPWMQDYKLKWKTELCIMSSSKVSLYYSFQGSLSQGRIKGWGVMLRRGVGLRFEPITSPTSSGYTFVVPRSRVKLSIIFKYKKYIWVL